jgi:DNA-binding CsgD family transcriptional regulator
LVSAVTCGFVRHPQQAEFGAEHVTKLAFLNQHYQRAMGLQQRLSMLEKQIVLANNALDLVQFGMLLFDNTRNPVFINKSAKRIFEKADGLEIGRDGLRINDKTAKEKFNNMLDGMIAARRSKVARVGGIVQVGRPSRKRNYNLMLVPMPESGSGIDKSTIAVLIFDPTQKQTTAANLFKSTYGFTKSETLLALELAQGESLAGFAKARDISKNTVRTQLRALFAKTDTSRQSELVSVLLHMAAGVDLG